MSFVRGSIRVTVPSTSSLTHTAPSPTATALAPLPTEILAIIRPERGSSRAISLPDPSVIQTASLVTATGRAAPPSSPIRQ